MLPDPNHVASDCALQRTGHEAPVAPCWVWKCRQTICSSKPSGSALHQLVQLLQAKHR